MRAVGVEVIKQGREKPPSRVGDENANIGSVDDNSDRGIEEEDISSRGAAEWGWWRAGGGEWSGGGVGTVEGSWGGGVVAVEGICSASPSVSPTLLHRPHSTATPFSTLC